MLFFIFFFALVFFVIWRITVLVSCVQQVEQFCQLIIGNNAHTHIYPHIMKRKRKYLLNFLSSLPSSLSPPRTQTTLLLIIIVVQTEQYANLEFVVLLVHFFFVFVAFFLSLSRTVWSLYACVHGKLPLAMI